MKSILLLSAVTLLALSGCMSSPTVKASPEAYLTGPAPIGITSEKIKTDITRGQNVPGRYWVEATLYTDPLIEATENEKGARQLDTKDKIASEIQTKKRLYTATHTCFMVELQAQTIGSAYFKELNAKVEDPSGALTDLKWSNENGIESVPEVSTGDGYRFFNFTVGCTVKLDPTKGIKLHLAHKVITDVTPTVLVWRPSSMVNTRKTAGSTSN